MTDHYVSYGAIPQFYQYVTENQWQGTSPDFPSWGMYTPIRIDGFRGQCYNDHTSGYQVIDTGELANYETHFVIHTGWDLPHGHIRARANTSIKFFGSVPLMYESEGVEDLGSIACFDYSHVAKNVRNVVFRKGVASSIDVAIRLVRLADRYVNESTLYKGRDSKIASFMYNTFVSDKTEVEYDVDNNYDGVPDEHYTLYTVTSVHLAVTSRVLPENQNGCYISNNGWLPSGSGIVTTTTYHTPDHHYVSYDEGEEREEFPTDLDLRVAYVDVGDIYSVGIPVEYLSLYFFNKTRENENPHASDVVYRKHARVRWFDNSAQIFSYIKSKNKLFYNNIDFGYDDSEELKHMAKRLGEDYVFAYAVENLFILLDTTLIDSIMEQELKTTGKYVLGGYGGFFAKLLCFHFKGSTQLVAEYNGIYYEVNNGSPGSLSQFFKYSFGKALDSEKWDSSTQQHYWVRFSVPNCSNMVFIHGDTLYKAKKNVLRLSMPSQKYIDDNKDTYTVGATTNKYDPGCSSMTLLTPIEIIEKESTWKTRYGTPDYTFRRKIIENASTNTSSDNSSTTSTNNNVSSNSFDPRDYFVETFGTVFIYNGSWGCSKNTAKMKNCFDLFTTKKDDTGGAETDVGLFFGPSSDPYGYLP